MLLADSGFWVAFIDRDDALHSRATVLMRDLKERLVTTGACLTEAMYVLPPRVGPRKTIALLELYKAKKFTVFELEQQHAERLMELMLKYADLPMDFADATVVVASEHYNSGRILSSDFRDFSVYRYNNTKRFTNLLAP